MSSQEAPLYQPSLSLLYGTAPTSFDAEAIRIIINTGIEGCGKSAQFGFSSIFAYALDARAGIGFTTVVLLVRILSERSLGGLSWGSRCQR